MSPLAAIIRISGLSFRDQYPTKWYLECVKVYIMFVSILFLLSVPLWTYSLFLPSYVESDDVYDNFGILLFFWPMWAHLFNLFIIHKNEKSLRWVFTQAESMTYPHVAIIKVDKSSKMALIVLAVLNVAPLAISIKDLLNLILSDDLYGWLIVLQEIHFLLVAYMWSAALYLGVVLQSFAHHRFSYCIEDILKSKSQMRRNKLLTRLCHDEIRFQKIFHELDGLFSPILLVTCLANFATFTFQMAATLNAESFFKIIWYQKFTNASCYQFCIVLLVIKGNMDLTRKVSLFYFARFVAFKM